MRTVGYQVFFGLAVMTAFRLACQWTPGRDVVRELAAVIAPAILQRKHLIGMESIGNLFRNRTRVSALSGCI